MAGFGGTLFGGLIAGEPTLPTLTTIDVGTEQQKAIANNTAALPAIEALTTQYDTFNQAQIEAMLAKAIPGYENIKGQISSNIESMLKGQVPSSDAAAQQLKSVSQSFGLGTTGSNFTGNLVARDLGLSQLGLMEQGISTAQSWMNTMSQIEGAGMFNASSMFVTPAQQIATDTSERNTSYEAQYLQNMMDWESSFGYLMGSDLNQTVTTAVNIAGGMLGGGSNSSAVGGIGMTSGGSGSSGGGSSDLSGMTGGMF